MELIYPEVFLTESEAPTQLSVLILCKVRAISKSDKLHIHLDMYLGQIGYRILDMVPSSVNRAYNRTSTVLCNIKQLLKLWHIDSLQSHFQALTATDRSDRLKRSVIPKPLATLSRDWHVAAWACLDAARAACRVPWRRRQLRHSVSPV